MEKRHCASCTLKWQALLDPCPISVLVILIMESKVVADPGDGPGRPAPPLYF